MSVRSLTPAHLDYLQHLSTQPLTIPQPKPGQFIPRPARRMFRVTGMGEYPPQEPSVQDQRPIKRIESQDLMIALAGYGAPLAFIVQGSAVGIEVFLGTWGPDDLSDARGDILRTALAAQFPEIDMSIATKGDVVGWPVGSLALGVPSPRPSREVEAPIDRIIRALQGQLWQILILAEPVNALVPTLIRTNALEESRQIQAVSQAERAPSPLAEHYVELLKGVVRQSVAGLAVGMWRYSSYLLSDARIQPALVGLWRGVFSGDESLPEPVMVTSSQSVPMLAEGWILLNDEAKGGPGGYRRMLEYQTLLTSSQLAQYVQFPRVDTPGFAVRKVSRFHAAATASPAEAKTICLGKIYAAGSGYSKTTNSADPLTRYVDFRGPEFRIDVDSLVKHTLVAGVTGVGKTNAVFSLITGIASHGRNFLVIEPAKKEYRSLLNDPELARDLKIYTLGDVSVSPFVINPFEPEPGTHVGMHLDLIRSVFTASFGMWTPLPQILERCLHEIYADRGWDLITGQNLRGASDRDPLAWPTLTNLALKIEEVIPTLGYDEKVANDMRAALLTRVGGLRRGAKGQMFDVRKSSAFSEILESNVVFELEGIADDDEKAFVIGLILIRLYEFRRRQQKTKSLRHLIVVEEAHRLLANVSEKTSAESANPRGKAVESFANLISEIRAYGQGVLVADQVPVKLAPDVIKNTNLKIVHRTVAGDDRSALASSMAMDASQERGLATLRTGQAAIFYEGEDAPLLVQMKPMATLEKGWPTDAVVREKMSRHSASTGPAGIDSDHGSTLPIHRRLQLQESVKEVVNDKLFRRDLSILVMSLMHGSMEANEIAHKLLARSNQFIPAGIEAADFYPLLIDQAARWIADRRGLQRGWTYKQTAEFEARLRNLIIGVIDHRSPDDAEWVAFRQFALQLHARRHEPFPGCNEICSENECLYRSAVEDHLLANSGLAGAWDEKFREQTGAGTIWDWLLAENKYVVGTQDSLNSESSPTLALSALCTAQHLLDPELPHVRKRVLEQLNDLAADYLGIERQSDVETSSR